MHFGWRLFDSAEGLAILALLNELVSGLPATRSHSATFCIPSAAGLCCATTAAQHQSICRSSGRCQTPRSQTEIRGVAWKGIDPTRAKLSSRAAYHRYKGFCLIAFEIANRLIVSSVYAPRTRF